MKIVCISDTHSLHYRMTEKVPYGDFLLHAGDLMNSGRDAEDIVEFLDWFAAFPHPHKIFIAGNHDHYFEKRPEQAKGFIDDKNAELLAAGLPQLIYLQDSEIVINGLKFYGSPWQPEFCNWAFNVPRGEELEKIWAKIPDDTDVLITHGPPKGILDWTQYDKLNVGCEALLPRVMKIKPKLHLFGHIHEAYGVHEENGTTFVNASINNLRYSPINKPFVFDFDVLTKKLTENI